MEYINAKTIVSNYGENDFWFGTNYNMNIYKGCCHGCIYCDSRSDCYGIEDFDRVRAKANSTEIISSELKKKKRKGIIGTGSMSDPYNPFEKSLELTRKALIEVDNNGFGVAIATKSSLITRDIDILKRIQSHSPALVKITITTFDDALCSKIERNVCSSSERFKAIKELSDNGIYTGILLMPILPFINDTEENIINIVREGSKAGAKFIYAYGFGLTLRGNQRDYFYHMLNSHFVDDVEGKSLVQKYIYQFGNSYENPSPKMNKLWDIFKKECTKHNILYKMEDIIEDYKKGHVEEQLTLFYAIQGVINKC